MSGFIPQKIFKAGSQTDLYAPMSKAALFTNQEMKATQCPS